MATPIIEQIAAAIESRVDNITTSNSYEKDVESVERPPRITQTPPRNYQAKVIQRDEVGNDELSCPGNPPVKAWDAEFWIVGILRQSSESTEPAATERNQFKADVQKAICTPASNWHQWGGLAINTELGQVSPYIDDEGQGFRYSIMVTFRTPENDPYTVA